MEDRGMEEKEPTESRPCIHVLKRRQLHQREHGCDRGCHSIRRSFQHGSRSCPSNGRCAGRGGARRRVQEVDAAPQSDENIEAII
eukprot:3418013-Pyramimonas_sp.AAC.1